MRVYAPSRDPMMLARSPPLCAPIAGLAFDGESAMSRRPFALLVLAITSFVLAACTSVTAPTSQNDTCLGGFVGSDGRCQ